MKVSRCGPLGAPARVHLCMPDYKAKVAVFGVTAGLMLLLAFHPPPETNGAPYLDPPFTLQSVRIKFKACVTALNTVLLSVDTAA